MRGGGKRLVHKIINRYELNKQDKNAIIQEKKDFDTLLEEFMTSISFNNSLIYYSGYTGVNGYYVIKSGSIQKANGTHLIKTMNAFRIQFFDKEFNIERAIFIKPNNNINITPYSEKNIYCMLYEYSNENGENLSVQNITISTANIYTIKNYGFLLIPHNTKLNTYVMIASTLIYELIKELRL